MDDLTSDQKRQLLGIVAETHLEGVGYGVFVEILHDLLDSIAGFELTSDAVRMALINELWGQYHGKGR
ncbi:MAG: hypothetical protein ACM3Q1_15890 [Bacteroidales bacterium]